MTFVLTIVLFVTNASPMAIIGVFEDRPACGLQENEVITKAMNDPSVEGYVLLQDCKLVKAVNKV